MRVSLLGHVRDELSAVGSGAPFSIEFKFFEAPVFGELTDRLYGLGGV